MYPGVHAKARANQPAIIMAQTGETLTYAELEARTNRLAHFLRNRGLNRLDHYAIFMENNVALRRVLRRRRTCGPLLHLHQLLPHRRRSRLHRQQQPIAAS